MLPKSSALEPGKTLPVTEKSGAVLSSDARTFPIPLQIEDKPTEKTLFEPAPQSLGIVEEEEFLLYDI